MTKPKWDSICQYEFGSLFSALRAKLYWGIIKASSKNSLVWIRTSAEINPELEALRDLRSELINRLSRAN